MREKIDYTLHYKRWHSDNPEHIREMIKFHLKTLESYLPDDRTVKILDVGCGMGFALMALNEKGFENTEGVEIDEGQVKSCQDKGLNVALVTNTTEYLNQHPNAFDLLICLDVIEHVPYDQQMDFVKGLHNALVPGGKLICTVPNANSDIAGRWRYIDWTHHISFTESSLSFLLENNNFQKVVVEEVDPYIRYFSGDYDFKEGVRSLLKVVTRANRRLSMLAELGLDEGWTIPLSVNLLAVAWKITS